MSEKRDSAIEAELRRHSNKFQEGEEPIPTPDGGKSGLTAEGIREAKNLASEIFKEIKESPRGSIYFLMPSNVGRAQETRDIIEAELQAVLKDNPEIEIISVQDAQKFENLSKEKKYVITELAGSSLIGYSNRAEEQVVGERWNEVKTLLDGDGMAAFKLWCAEPEEIDSFKQELKQKFPGVPAEEIEKINPESFKLTPEDYTIKAFRWLSRIRSIAQERFPDRYVKFTGISHDDVSDFLTFVLLGYKLNIKTLEQFKTLRTFLEKSSYKFTSQGLEIEYRGERKTIPNEELDDFVSSLKQAKKERLKNWQKKE